MDKSMKSLDKSWNDSLSFMDNIYIKVVLYVVLILFSSTYFENINMYFGSLHKNYKFLNIVVLLLIVYLGRKCPVVGILLGISYIISLNYMSSKENFFPGFGINNHNEKFISGSGDGTENSSGDDDDDKSNNANALTPDTLPNSSNNDNIESFFPGLMSNRDEKDSQSFNVEKKNSSDCKSLYTPEYESVGDVCNSVNTFKDELNAQGLNSPEGFNSNVFGSPL
jgi:hypothetical protein